MEVYQSSNYVLVVEFEDQPWILLAQTRLGVILCPSFGQIFEHAAVIITV
jgi:hypothetical protein